MTPPLGARVPGVAAEPGDKRAQVLAPGFAGGL